MRLSFGPFVLDAEARRLTLDGAEVALQPRAFDLLVYLARHAGRVVPKDELLDALWPGVTVTEGSLQRAASLVRTALRRGGMEEALRAYPRHGYRFSPDAPGLGALAPAAVAAPDAAREAVARRDWAAAAEAFARAEAAGGLDGGSLDLWGHALECAGRHPEAIPVRARAVAAHGAAGDRRAAARGAVELARLHYERAEVALANGWVERAAGFLAGLPEGAEAGGVQWMRSRIASFEGQPEAALAHAERAAAIGRAAGDDALVALGLGYGGFYKLCLGRTAEGFADLDHAAAIALSAGVDPVTGGLVYCAVLWACRSVGDWARADQWSLGFQSWCAAGLTELSGACELHRAEVLVLRGPLAEARQRVEDAIARLPSDEPWAIGDAWRVLGDIEAALGDREAARAAYVAAYARGWDGEPGHALMLAEEGDVDGALAALDRAMLGRGWRALQRRGLLLAHKALVLARAGRTPEARALLEPLPAEARAWPGAALRALVAEAEAALAAAPVEALGHLLAARVAWTGAGSELDAARVRLAIARHLARHDDPAGARLEVAAARASAARIGARALERDAVALEARLAPAARAS